MEKLVEVEKRFCLYCGKELIKQEGKEQLNSKRKFCNHICGARHNAIRQYNKKKDNKEYKKMARERFQEWYLNNKERQKKTILKYYYLNKDKWGERTFVSDHREKIKQFINPLCSCGQPTKIFFHRHYGNVIPIKGDMKERLLLIKKYTDENLIGVCSKLCLHKEKRKLINERREDEKNID